MNNFLHGFIPEHIYHVYNRTNNAEALFKCDKQRLIFLNKLKQYTDDCLHLFAYCLMNNHFHLLIKLKGESEIRKSLSKQKVAYLKKMDLHFLAAMPHNYYHSFISKRLSNFFNSYTKSFNIMNERKGNLFNRNFKRVVVNDQAYLFTVIKYIHYNPIKELIVDDLCAYQWSSYEEILRQNSEFISIDEMMKYVGGMRKFIDIHK